jgi:transcriptional regulator with XRE-family HTH domain
VQPPGSSEALGRAVRRLRDERGLTQEALADRARITPVYVSRIERGRGNPTWRILVDLAAALEIRVADLAREVERSPEA